MNGCLIVYLTTLNQFHSVSLPIDGDLRFFKQLYQEILFIEKTVNFFLN